MSDETIPAAPSPVTATTDTVSAPAVHSDTLWGGARWVQNATAEPVWVETKEEYWSLLNKTGFRVQDQAESSTGPELEPVAPIPKVWAAPAPLMETEAVLISAMDAFYARYQLIETLWCNICVQRGQASGCRTIVKANHVEITCRCGQRIYRPPVGTTDLGMSRSTAPTENDKTSGTVLLPTGPAFRPTVILHADEARLLREWARWVTWRDLEPRLFHRGCFNNTVREDDAMGLKITADQVTLLCKCRVLFFHGTHTRVTVQ